MGDVVNIYSSERVPPYRQMPSKPAEVVPFPLVRLQEVPGVPGFMFWPAHRNTAPVVDLPPFTERPCDS